jgi:hypothetical protein
MVQPLDADQMPAGEGDGRAHAHGKAWL